MVLAPPPRGTAIGGLTGGTEAFEQRVAIRSHAQAGTLRFNRPGDGALVERHVAGGQNLPRTGSRLISGGNENAPRFPEGLW